MWMVLNQNPKDRGRTDISDLNQDPIVVWQHKYYGGLILVFGMLFPMVVAGLGWDDWKGGLVYAGILRLFFLQQATFCVNSLAHWLGDQVQSSRSISSSSPLTIIKPFDDRNSPRDHVITALVTLGEGYHNFHHEVSNLHVQFSISLLTRRQFPSDYRNAIEWWQYDPTKWSIWIWKQIGLASNLKSFRANEIEKGRIQQLQKKIDQMRVKIDWGIPLEHLPVFSWDDFVSSCRAGNALIVIAGVIYDVTDFIKEHPGGKALLSSGIGKDATAIFNGGIYKHSNAAHNLLSTMRAGIIRGGSEVEIWREKNREKLAALGSS
jgi:stearoyl-CoA desaturase (delta-9 desaturase)